MKRKSTKLTERVGRNVAAQRKSLGITQEQLATQVGVEPVTISRIERGVNVPSLTMLEALAGELGISIAALLDEETPAVPSEADVITTLMNKMKGKEKAFVLAFVRMYSERNR